MCQSDLANSIAQLPFIGLVGLAEIGALTRPPQRRVMQNVTHWLRPPPPFCTINFDGSFRGRTKQGAGGLVVRNSDGEMMRAVSLLFPNTPSPFMAEAKAVIKRMQSTEEDRSEIGSVIASGRHLAASFSCCRFKLVPKDGNILAQLLAQHRFSVNEDKFWWEDFPEFIRL